MQKKIYGQIARRQSAWALGDLMPPQRKNTNSAIRKLPSAFCVIFKCQHGADVWAWWEDRRANYAESPTSRSHIETQSLKQRSPLWAETSVAA
ncbi:MAG: hypothetical protein ACI86S_000328 [Paracoccaceae bacterium]|jgi:hypothetical protein